MKKIIAGIGIMVVSLVLFLSVHIPAIRFISNLGAWTTPPGKYMTGMIQVGGIGVFYLSLILGIFGLTLTLIGVFEKKS